MQAIEARGLVRLDQALEHMLKESPKLRRVFHEEMADMIKSKVDTAISFSGLNDARGKVKRWQVRHVGSGGGYAAVRPANEKAGGDTGPDSAGAVTNYLENGHRTRGRAGGPKRKIRLNIAAVPGYHFYRSAKGSVQTEALKIAGELADALVDMVEGAL